MVERDVIGMARNSFLVEGYQNVDRSRWGVASGVVIRALHLQGRLREGGDKHFRNFCGRPSCAHAVREVGGFEDQDIV